MKKDLSVFTIGHSTRSIEDFIEILKQYYINELVDIRTLPKSRHNPQFNGEELAHVLRNHHINYRHEKSSVVYVMHPKIQLIWLGKIFHSVAMLITCKPMNLKKAYKNSLL